MRHFFLCLALVVLLVGCGRGPSSPVEARQIAEGRFAKVCLDFKLHSSAYEGPIPAAVGGVEFAYEWRKKENTGEGVLVTVASNGAVDVSFIVP